MCCHFHLQWIFPTQGLNPHLLHWEVNYLHHATWEIPKMVEQIVLFFHLHVNNKTYREYQL